MIKNIQESQEGMIDKWGQVTEDVNQTLNTREISLEYSAEVVSTKRFIKTFQMFSGN